MMDIKHQVSNPKHQINSNIQTPITKPKFDLEARTLKFAKEVIRFCREIRQDAVNRELIGQLIRASGSVGANYREANEALSKKDFVMRVKICRKEAKESAYWLRLIIETSEDSYKQEGNLLINEAIELKKIFSSMIEK